MSATFCKGCGGAIDPSWRYCSSCGSSTGLGLAPPPATSSKPVWIIAIVAVLFLAIPVTGIIAAIAIPNMLTAMQRAKQKRTMADIRSLGTAMEAYAVDNNTYPPYGSDVDAIEELISPTYIRQVPHKDGWNRELRYHCLDPGGDFCRSYALQSAGKDGLFDDLPSEILSDETNDFDCDILYADGVFVWYPKGAGRGGR